MELTSRQEDMTASAHDACMRVGLYHGFGLEAFRELPCAQLVGAAGKSCPLSPTDYGIHLNTFLARLVANLEDLGYVPRIRLRLLCAVKQTPPGFAEWTWGDWCDYHASRI